MPSRFATLLYHSTSDRVSLFETNCEHANHILEPHSGLSIELKPFIKEKFEEDAEKPNTILNLIRRKQQSEPSKSQIIIYLRKLRLEKMALIQFQPMKFERCEEHNGVPSDDDEPFVINHHIFAESFNIEEQDLKIVFSTCRLLRFQVGHDPIPYAYKFVWQRLSCLDNGNH